MNKKENYVTPEVNELELSTEGFLCSSERNGGIDQLEEGLDWSDMWN